MAYSAPAWGRVLDLHLAVDGHAKIRDFRPARKHQKPGAISAISMAAIAALLPCKPAWQTAIPLKIGVKRSIS